MENYVLDFNGTRHTFRYDETDRGKYTIFACAKNENDYIVEWVDYHLSIGFDKIFVCDNNDIGDDSLREILKAYIENGTVEIFDIRGFEAFQCFVYDMYSSVGNYEWCAFIDVDEFIEVGSHFDGIKDFLSAVKEDCVLLNWMMYGYDDNLYKTGGNVSENYTKPIRNVGLFKENSWMKSIVRGSSHPRFYNNMHTAVFDEPGHYYLVAGAYVSDSNERMSFPPIYKYAYIRHYYSRSVEDFFNKSRRSDAYVGKPGTEGFMTNTYNLSLLSNTPIMPIEKLVLGLYMHDEVYTKYNEDILSYYDVINVCYTSENPYHMIHFVSRLMMSAKDSTIILSGRIDNTVFNMLLDYSFDTSNRLVWCEDDSGLLYKCYLKYTKKPENETYYKYIV